MAFLANHPVAHRLLFTAFITVFCGSLLADQEGSTWGLGLGLAAGFYPHYPAADQSETLLVPFPYPEYHGEKITLDTDGLIANLFNSERFNLDISLNGSLPVSDEDNNARQGMDDLELILEFGPELEMTLMTWENARFRLDLPIRSAFEVTLDKVPKDVGFSFDPRFHFEQEFEHWEWDLDFGALFATERYHALYYDVPEVFVTPERSLYQAESGLTGWRLSSSAERRWGDWAFHAYLRYLNFSSAANEESPLLIEKDYLAGGIALIWFFKTSDKNH